MNTKVKKFGVLLLFTLMLLQVPLTTSIRAEENAALSETNGQVMITVVSSEQQGAYVDVQNGSVSVNCINVDYGTPIKLVAELFGYELKGWEVQNADSTWSVVLAPTQALESKTYRPTFEELPIYNLDVVVNPSSSADHITVELASSVAASVPAGAREDIMGVFYEGDSINISIRPDQQTQITGYKLEKLGTPSNQVVTEVIITAPTNGGEITESIVSLNSNYRLTLEAVTTVSTGGDTTVLPPSIPATEIVTPVETKVPVIEPIKPLEAPIVPEPIVEVVATLSDEVVPLGQEELPKTGGIPSQIYCLLGTCIVGMGVILKIKRH